MRLPFLNRTVLRIVLIFSLSFAVTGFISSAQQPKPTVKTPDKSTTATANPSAKESVPENPAQLELLETKYRFEADGSSRKEVHARVRIHNELGARQFGRLNFDYNRSFESVEIPLVRITHAKGGTADILPSAITDNPKPEVADAPAYQDVRAKSVRILGLQPTDVLEYRVITTVAHAPLAPNFYLSHSFDRSGVVAQELFELDLPTRPTLQIHIDPHTPATSTQESKDKTRTVYRWQRSASPKEATATSAENKPDIILTTFKSWNELYSNLVASLTSAPIDDSLKKKAQELTASIKSPREQFEAIYGFVSQKIKTVDLPAGATGFHGRNAAEIISSGFATPEDKCSLLLALSYAAGLHAELAVTDSTESLRDQLPRISPLNHFLLLTRETKSGDWLDPSLEVAPFGVLPSNLRGKLALAAFPAEPQNTPTETQWIAVPQDLPYPAKQLVNVDASLDAAGKLSAKVHYSLRGDNELLLRIAFHQTPKEKWSDLAQLLSISDGFRGQIISANASDPYATNGPFTVDYEISTPKFVDWSKKPVRIPALLPQVGLPDPPAKSATDSAVSAIELGTPLEVETTATLQLPAGTTAHTPTGTSVERDYATFSSKYSFTDAAISASRHINFLLRQVPATRIADYNAFLHAVQSDSAQLFTLQNSEISPAKTNSAALPASAPPNKSPKKP